VITKREVLDALVELRRRNPRAAAPRNGLSVDPHKTDVVISHVLEVFNSTGLTAQQAKDVLAHLKSWLKSASVSRMGRPRTDDHGNATPLSTATTVHSDLCLG
jgi:hypothetical protein